MSLLTVTFITTNYHKFQEAAAVLKNYSVQLVHLNQSYEENHDSSLEEIARTAAKKLAEELQKPIILEDTGLFFDAYSGFPGALPKFVFHALGYKGILKLLDNELRTAYFKTVAGFCEPSHEPLLFAGTMRGSMTEEVHNADQDAMPYDRIFIPQGKTITISDMTIAEKNVFSQRAQAFRQFGEYLRSR